MNKENILEKSKKENKLGDERHKFIEKGASATGYTLGFAAYIMLEVISKYKIRIFDITPANIMLMAMIAGSSGYTFLKKLNKDEKNYTIFNGVITLIAISMFILHSYSFLTGK